MKQKIESCQSNEDVNNPLVITRRNFIKTIGASALAIAVNSLISTPAMAESQELSPEKVGNHYGFVVGLGDKSNIIFSYGLRNGLPKADELRRTHMLMPTSHDRKYFKVNDELKIQVPRSASSAKDMIVVVCDTEGRKFCAPLNFVASPTPDEIEKALGIKGAYFVFKPID